MGGYMIPLEGMRAPQQNPYQAALQAQQETVNAQSLMQQRQQQAAAFPLEQQIRQNQVRAGAVQTQIQQADLDEMRQQQKEQELLRQAYIDHSGDLTKALPAAAAAGVRPKTLAPLYKSQLEQQEAMAKLSSTDLDWTIKRHDALNGALMGQFQTRGADGSAEWRQPTPEEWTTFVHQQAATGYLKPEDLQALQKSHPDGSAPSPQELQLTSMGLNTATQLAARGKEMQQEREAFENTEKARLGNEQTARSAAISRLGSAGTYGDVTNIAADLVRQNPKLAGTLPEFGDRDPKAAVTSEDRARIERAGQTPEQQAQTRVAEERAADALQSRLDANDIRKEIADTSREMLRFRMDQAQNGHGQTANSMAVDVRQARSEYEKLLLQEQNMQRQRLALVGLLKQNTDPKTGRVTPYADPKTGQERDLSAELESATDGLAELLVSKHDAAERAGMKLPRTLGDALKRIGRPLEEEPGAATPPAAPASAAPKPAATSSAPAPAAAAPKSTLKTWTVGGQQRAQGSSMWVNGKEYIFDGLGRDGKILAHPK